MRYLVFAGDTYYPLGGARDFLAAYATEREAVAHAQLRRLADVDGLCASAWAHVFDVETQQIIHYATRED